MPGFELVYSFNKLKSKTIQEIENSLIKREHYFTETIFYNEYCYLGCSRYEEYPIRVIDKKNYILIIEGKIYNKNAADIAEDLNCIYSLIKKNSNLLNYHINRWILDTDGDFAIIFIDKKNSDVYIINDLLGRLPIYVKESKDKIIISREFKFIQKLSIDCKYDKIAIAELFLFDYPLGNRTFLDKIKRLEPATLILLENNPRRKIVKTIHEFNYGQRNNKNTIKNNSSNLVDLFVESCSNRYKNSCESIVSLSGGMDSRAIAAGLHRGNKKFYSATFSLYDGSTINEEIIAEELSNRLKSPWKIYKIDQTIGDQDLELIDIKSGLNSVNMSFIIQFFQNLIKDYGRNLTYFTGDGGDKMLPNLHPLRKFGKIRSLRDYILERNYLNSIDVVSRLLRIKKEEILLDIDNLLVNYPESDLDNKFIHFIIHERAMNWLFEGEDRNRCYFWSVAPFWGTHFFSYAMKCPVKQKIGNMLYIQFLKNLNNSCGLIKDSNSNLIPFSPLYLIRQATITLLKRNSTIYRAIKNIAKMRSGYSYNYYMVQKIQDKIINNECINDYLSTTYIKEIMENSNRYNRSLINNIYTFILFHESIRTVW